MNKIATEVMLAIETSTTICSVALWDGQRQFERVDEKPRSHSQRLLPMVDAVLQASNLSLSGVDKVICSRGPGSFTGVRIGIGVAKGLAYGHNLPIIPVSPLQAIAYQLIAQMPSLSSVTALLDARMGEVYAADYSNDKGVPVLLGKERLTTVDALSLDNRYVAGTGVPEYQSLLLEKGAKLSTVVYPFAKDMIALLKKQKTPEVSAMAFSPTYLRDKVIG